MYFLLTTEPVQWRLTDITDHWGSRGGHAISMTWFFITISVLIATVSAVGLTRWYRRRQAQPSHDVTFRRVAKLSGLGPRQRSLLKRIAKRSRMNTPLTLIFSQATLRLHSDPYLKSLPTDQRYLTQTELSLIGQLLFEP